MNTSLHALLLAGLAALAIASAPVRAAESYDNCTGFIDSLPAAIGTQGVWCLRKNLSTAMTSGAAIAINTHNVTIDCNDFKVGGLAAGNGSLATGIYANSRMNATIRNCGIRGFLHGIYLDGDDGAGHLVEDNRLDNNLHVGILVKGEHNLVQRNRVYDTGGATGQNTSYGILAGADVLDNTVRGVFAAAAGDTYPRGIQVNASGGEVRGNRVGGLISTGAGWAIGINSLAGGVTVAGNRVVAASFPDPGFGINGGNTFTACSHNVVMGFDNNYTGCGASFGDIALP